jgi:hypothetical protein
MLEADTHAWCWCGDAACSQENAKKENTQNVTEETGK